MNPILIGVACLPAPLTVVAVTSAPAATSAVTAVTGIQNRRPRFLT